MPITSSLKKPIEKIYRKDWLDTVVFGYIEGAKKENPNRSIEDLIRDFLASLGESTDWQDVKTISVSYKRTKEAFRELVRNNNKIPKADQSRYTKLLNELAFLLNDDDFNTHLNVVSDMLGQGSSFNKLKEYITKLKKISEKV